MKAFRAIALGCQRVIDATGLPALCERRALSRAGADGPVPIFILGPPRSGTTLLYELMAGHLRVGYLTNIAAMFARAPVTATRAASRVLERPVPKYRSDLGFVAGLMAPSEAGAVVRHWFLDADALCERQSGVLVRRAFAEIARVMGGPVVIKNLNLDMALERVLRVFPEALLVRVTRAARFTAQSILEVRKRQFGDIAHWWSVRPPGYERLGGMDPYLQVAWQLRLIDEAVERGIAAHGGRAAVVECGYERLCADPGAVLDDIRATYKSRFGRSLDLMSAPPSGFDASEQVVLDADQWSRLERALERVAAAAQLDADGDRP